MSVVEGSRRAGRVRRWLIGAAAGWLALLVGHYLAYPLSAVLPLGGLVVGAACWVLAAGCSVAALVALLQRRAYGWATVVLLVAAGVGGVLWTTDWERVYVDSQFRLHRDGLDDLAAQHRAGTLPTDARLPWQLGHLSVDGQSHRSGDARYLPLWQDWRGESGVGIAYFPTPPGPDTLIATAPGDVGQPVRHLGDGWWWVE
ncbi:hypothetical protein [Micromonospora maritima]|uniref:Uncharacterized protein n=1 Tax=Micromonospora maritima TaxID=986711 RepID=A0ABW7ZHN0_9ACTN